MRRVGSQVHDAERYLPARRWREGIYPASGPRRLRAASIAHHRKPLRDLDANKSRGNSVMRVPGGWNALIRIRSLGALFFELLVDFKMAVHHVCNRIQPLASRAST